MQPKLTATKKKHPAQDHDDPAQTKRFLDAAREAEADETEEGARRAFKTVVEPKKRGK